MPLAGPPSSLQEITFYTGQWWKHRHILILNLMLVMPLATSYANGFDSAMMNGLQSVGEWKEYFGHPNAKQLGLFNAIQNIGSLCAIPLASFISDQFGRRAGIFSGASTILAGAIIQTLVRNIATFIAARFMVGFGLTLAMMASPLLVSELAYPTHRAPLIGLYHCLWFSGSIVAGWTTFGTLRIPNDWSWRIPSALQGLPSLVQCILVWFIPDSPRWLISKGRDQEALEVLKEWHAGGEENNTLVHFEYNEIQQAINSEAEQNHSGWLDLFRTPGNRRRMRIVIAIALFSQISGNGCIGYYLERVLNGIGIVKSRDQTLINACIAMWNIVFAVGASMSVDRFGRRKLFLMSNTGMLVSFAILTACAGAYQNAGETRARYGFLAAIFLYQIWYTIAYTPLLVLYTVEILPFFLRAKGLAMVYLTMTLGLIFSQYTDPIALEALKYKYYMIYTVWLVFELLFVYFFAVETKNRSLEETAALFDGDAALPDIEGGLRPGNVMAENQSSYSSRTTLPLCPQPIPCKEMMEKPRIFDHREGFQLYDLLEKPVSRSHTSL